MIDVKMVGIGLVAFAAGAFLASPELRAYASTIANDVICNGCVGTSDLAGNAVTATKIKDGEVKAAEIATNAVGASEVAPDAVGGSELQGVTKLLFGQCVPTDFQKTSSVTAGFVLDVVCNIAGVDGDDSATATLNGGTDCFKVANVLPSTGGVTVSVRNDCSSNATLGFGTTIAVIVYDK